MEGQAFTYPALLCTCTYLVYRIVGNFLVVQIFAFSCQLVNAKIKTTTISMKEL